VKGVCTDGGSEYTSKTFTEYLKSEGRIKEMTTPCSLQSNGVVERANDTIMKRVQYVLDDAGYLQKNWAFAVSVAVCVKNRTPKRSVVGKSPYEAWHGRKPSLKSLRMFGCLAFVDVPKETRKKTDYRATPGIFVGYSMLTKQHFVYDTLARTLHRSRDVVLREGQRYTAPNAADEVIFNEHFYREVIVEPTSTKQSETSQPMVKQPTERYTEEPLDDNSPPDPPTRK
jgi:hypothetical protein